MAKKKRKRKPPELRLVIAVWHPDSIEFDAKANWPTEQSLQPRDGDGHYIDFEMAKCRSKTLVEIALQRGMDGRAAGAILRKVAERLERHGAQLFNLRQGQGGHFTEHGEIERNPAWFELAFDDYGDFPFPMAADLQIDGYKDAEGNTPYACLREVDVQGMGKRIVLHMEGQGHEEPRDCRPEESVSANPPMTAAEVVRAWADGREMSKWAMGIVKRFLEQWPEGPQIEEHEEEGEQWKAGSDPGEPDGPQIEEDEDEGEQWKTGSAP